MIRASPPIEGDSVTLTFAGSSAEAEEVMAIDATCGRRLDRDEVGGVNGRSMVTRSYMASLIFHNLVLFGPDLTRMDTFPVYAIMPGISCNRVQIPKLVRCS